jgi:hypothetical protein
MDGWMDGWMDGLIASAMEVTYSCSCNFNEII